MTSSPLLHVFESGVAVMLALVLFALPIYRRLFGGSPDGHASLVRMLAALLLPIGLVLLRPRHKG